MAACFCTNFSLGFGLTCETAKSLCRKTREEKINFNFSKMMGFCKKKKKKRERKKKKKKCFYTYTHKEEEKDKKKGKRKEEKDFFVWHQALKIISDK